MVLLLQVCHRVVYVYNIHLVYTRPSNMCNDYGGACMVATRLLYTYTCNNLVTTLLQCCYNVIMYMVASMYMVIRWLLVI